MSEDCPEAKWRNRSFFAIVAETLEVAERGANKLQIMYGANLSYAQANRYLLFLLDRNLLQSSKKSRVNYQTTEKGYEFLRQYTGIRELLE